MKRRVARTARRPSLTGPARDGVEILRVRTEGWALQGPNKRMRLSDRSRAERP